MKRILVVGVGLVAAAGILVGCSDDKGVASQVSTSGNTSVKVEGQDLSGVDLKTVTCVKAGGKINVASGAAGGQQGLAVIMTDANPPVVESVAMVVDGNALAVSQLGGVKSGSAEAKADGSNYTITGEAQGADIKNPTAGLITKKFEIQVTCN